jgi:hypothetical protein
MPKLSIYVLVSIKILNFFMCVILNICYKIKYSLEKIVILAYKYIVLIIITLINDINIGIFVL